MANQFYETIGVRSQDSKYDRAANLFINAAPQNSLTRGILHTSYKRRAPRIVGNGAQRGRALVVKDAVNVQIPAAATLMATPDSMTRSTIQSSYTRQSPLIVASTRGTRALAFGNLTHGSTDDTLIVPAGFIDKVRALRHKGYPADFVESFVNNLSFKRRHLLTASQKALYDQLIGHHVRPAAPAAPAAPPVPPNQVPRVPDGEDSEDSDVFTDDDLPSLEGESDTDDTDDTDDDDKHDDDDHPDDTDDEPDDEQKVPPIPADVADQLRALNRSSPHPLKDPVKHYGDIWEDFMKSHRPDAQEATETMIDTASFNRKVMTRDQMQRSWEAIVEEEGFMEDVNSYDDFLDHIRGTTNVISGATNKTARQWRSSMTKGTKRGMQVFDWRRTPIVLRTVPKNAINEFGVAP